MDQLHIENFAKTFRKKFDKKQMAEIKERLVAVPDEKLDQVMKADYKSPYGMSWIAWLVGEFGVDRFILHDTKKGIITLIFFWAFIPWVISWWTIEKRTRKYDFEQFEKAIAGSTVVVETTEAGE